MKIEYNQTIRKKMIRWGYKVFIRGILLCLLAACNLPLLPATPISTPRPILIPSNSLSATPDQPSPSPLPSATAVPTNTHLPSATSSPTTTDTPVPQTLRFAVIGDYGSGGQFEAEVAEMIKSWGPQLIITVGDNNYPDGSAETIDRNIGQFFHEFISPYNGIFGSGAEVNHFFPSLGNHDWNTDQAQPYLDYFSLPGNERYYSFSRGPIHFFVLDSDSREPDGVGRTSPQAVWLQDHLMTSESTWKIVYFHHAPYSSGLHGPVEWMQWPFADWGADFVISGHDHTYERILREGITYFVNGLGGASIYKFIIPTEGSQVRYNDDYGAMLVEASENIIRFQFINRLGQVIDDYQASRP